MAALRNLSNFNKFRTLCTILPQKRVFETQMTAMFSSCCEKYEVLRGPQRNFYNFSTNSMNSGNSALLNNFISSRIRGSLPFNCVYCRTLLTEVDSVEAYQKKIDTEKLVVVQYSASWCGPCRQMKPIVLKLSNEEQDVEFLFVDIDDQSSLAEQAGIENVPTFVLLKQGKVVDRIVGANADKLRSSMEKYK